MKKKREGIEGGRGDTRWGRGLKKKKAGRKKTQGPETIRRLGKKGERKRNRKSGIRREVRRGRGGQIFGSREKETSRETFPQGSKRGEEKRAGEGTYNIVNQTTKKVLNLQLRGSGMKQAKGEEYVNCGKKDLGSGKRGRGLQMAILVLKKLVCKLGGTRGKRRGRGTLQRSLSPRNKIQPYRHADYVGGQGRAVLIYAFGGLGSSLNGRYAIKASQHKKNMEGKGRGKEKRVGVNALGDEVAKYGEDGK